MSTQAGAVEVMTQVAGIVQSIALLTGKVVSIYDNTDLQDKLKQIVFPGAGLVYEGMYSLPSVGATDKIGASAEMRFSIVLIMRRETIIRTDTKNPMLELLTLIRQSLLGKTSVTGHKYKFVVEAPAEVKNEVTFWVQRWAVPIQLPPTQV